MHYPEIGITAFDKPLKPTETFDIARIGYVQYSSGHDLDARRGPKLLEIDN